jgi:hypothetical protein
MRADQKYVLPVVGMAVHHVERAERRGRIIDVYPDELEEGPGHRMVKVQWPDDWTYEASFMLRSVAS